MPPQETTTLLPDDEESGNKGHHRYSTVEQAQASVRNYTSWLRSRPQHLSFGDEPEHKGSSKQYSLRRLCQNKWTASVLVLVVSVVSLAWWASKNEETPLHPPYNVSSHNASTLPPYQLLERHAGRHFFDYYDLFHGPDSLGSAGFQTYIGPYETAQQLGLINVTTEHDEELVYIGSVSGTAETYSVGDKATPKPVNGTYPRASVRLEGKRRFASDTGGLFVLDLLHMPASVCGVWPAWWLTDDDKDQWPAHGEMDIVEGVNYQTRAKTALHTSADCQMYGHVSTAFDMTGDWDRATGIPDTWTGLPDNTTNVPADNCNVMAPHQWANQGCVAVHDEPDTIGAPLNRGGGGIYALEWDPAAGYIKSWVFPRHAGHMPANLLDSIAEKHASTPDPTTWGLPYAYFAIGEGSGCSANHFDNLRLVHNLAFCGTVAGNRFFTDCPSHITQRFNVSGDPVASCNAYIASNPPELELEAYWKIRSVSVFQRKSKN